jgi:hypothetical protein
MLGMPIILNFVDTWTKTAFAQADAVVESLYLPTSPPPDGNAWPWWDAVSIPLQLLVLAGVGWIVWGLLRGRPEIRLKVHNGAVHVMAGKVRPVLLGELSDVIGKEGVKQGTITGRRKSGRIVLTFSRDFLPAVQQQIRNTWYSNS